MWILIVIVAIAALVGLTRLRGRELMRRKGEVDLEKIFKERPLNPR